MLFILKILYHFLSAIIISFILLISNVVIDLFLQHTHLTQLLLNIDFLTNPQNVPTWMEIIIHLFIGISIYIVFVILYYISKHFYHLAYLPLMIIFVIMYPLLISIAQRLFFTFSWLEYMWWMIAHIIFTLLMYISISFISRNNKYR
ncbi:hypothetical protein ABH524_002395 [Staphylococcus pasteuri]